MKQVTIELTDKEAQIVGLVSNLLLANCFQKLNALKDEPH